MKLFKRWGDAALLEEIEELRLKLREAESRVHILELEQQKLLDVCARDRQRVLAETQRFSAEIADADRRAKAPDTHAHTPLAP